MANTARLFVWFALLVAALVVVIFFLGGGGGSRLTSSELPPSEFVFVSDEHEVIVVDAFGEQTVIVDLDEALTASSLTDVESIEQTSATQLFVGTCCESGNGRQFIVDLSTGRVDFFPVTMRFPSVDSEAMVLLSGGQQIRVENLGSLLAYENGVGVVAPGPTVHEGSGDEVLRPVALPMNRVAFVSSGVLSVANHEGEVLFERDAVEIATLAYDERNDVLIGLVASNTVQLIEPETLDVIGEWTLDGDAHSIDALNGWLLVSSSDGSVIAHRIDGSEPTELIESGSAVASWMVNG